MAAEELEPMSQHIALCEKAKELKKPTIVFQTAVAFMVVVSSRNSLNYFSGNTIHGRDRRYSRPLGMCQRRRVRATRDGCMTLPLYHLEGTATWGLE